MSTNTPTEYVRPIPTEHDRKIAEAIVQALIDWDGPPACPYIHEAACNIVDFCITHSDPGTGPDPERWSKARQRQAPSNGDAWPPVMNATDARIFNAIVDACIEADEEMGRWPGQYVDMAATCIMKYYEAPRDGEKPCD